MPAARLSTWIILTSSGVIGGLAETASIAKAGMVSSGTGSFSFDSGGRPSVPLPGTTITLNSTNADDPVRQIIVAAETGYVYH